MDADRFMQLLQERGERLTWAIGSTVYRLADMRYIIWTHPKPGEGRPFRVAPLPDSFGSDHYLAADAFLADQRQKGWPLEQPRMEW